MPYFVVLVGCMLVCTLGMGAMMWLMMRGMGSGSHPINPSNSSSVMDALPAPIPSIVQASGGRDAEVAELRAQIQDLELRNRALHDELEIQSSGDMPSDTREGELAR